MSRLIDVDKLPYEKMEISATSEEWCVRLSDIENAPTVDAVPIRHGEWIFGETMHHEWMKCSECLKSQTPTGCFTYCPNCGAKMDGERSTE